MMNPLLRIIEEYQYCYPVNVGVPILLPSE